MDLRRGSGGSQPSGTCGPFSEFITFSHSTGIPPRGSQLLNPSAPSLPLVKDDESRWVQWHSYLRSRHEAIPQGLIQTVTTPRANVCASRCQGNGGGARIHRSDWMRPKHSFSPQRLQVARPAAQTLPPPQRFTRSLAPPQPWGTPGQTAAVVHSLTPLPAELRLT